MNMEEIGADRPLTLWPRPAGIDPDPSLFETRKGALETGQGGQGADARGSA
jgi:hypothetical protein